MKELDIARDERRIRDNREALNKTSASLSNRIYLLNGAILGSIWAFAVGDDLAVNGLSVLSVCLSLMAVIADLAQMWAGYLDQRRLYAALLREQQTAPQNLDRPLLRWRMMLFDVKLALTALSGAIFLVSCFVMLRQDLAN